MSSVPGGADLERKNQYWIDLGIARERDRIIALLENQLWREPNGEVVDDYDLNGNTQFLIELIKGENNG